MKTKIYRPVLVSTGINAHDTFMVGNLEYHTDKKLSINGIEQKLVLVSLDPDEKIEAGDECYNYTLQSIKIADTSYYNEFGWFKVIAIQHQLPLEYIFKFMEEYNRGDVKDVEVEMELKILDDDVFTNHMCKPKLSDGFVKIKKEPKIFTEDEVIELLKKCNMTFGFATSNELHEWFDKNKNKNKT